MEGFAPDDESWRTQRKKINNAELGAVARKRVLRDLRRLKKEQESLGIEVGTARLLPIG
jgi:hypothetical protein